MAFRIIRRMDDRDLRRAKMVKEKSLPIAKFAIWQIFLSICWADSRLRRDLCVDSHLHTSLTPSTCISTSTCDSHLTSALRSVDVCAWSFKIIAHSDTIKTLSVLHFSLSLQLQFKKLFFFSSRLSSHQSSLEHVHQFHRYSARWGLLKLFCLENVTIITDLTCTLPKHA
jgi:hypothetical protein